MGTVRTVGGFLSIAGCAMILIWAILFANIYFSATPKILLVKWILTVGLALFALAGSVLGMGTRRIGILFNLFVGIIWTMFWILFLIGAVNQSSTLGFLFDVSYNFSIVGYYIVGTGVIGVESLIILVGSLLMVADRPE